VRFRQPNRKPCRLTVVIKVFVVFATLALSISAASASCWQGSAESGQLRFSGAVEDEKFNGKFGEFEVEVCRPDGTDWEASEWTVSVATGSADTRNRDRDETLLGRFFFAVDDFPSARWRSDLIASDPLEENTKLIAQGELELRGQRLPQAVTIELMESADGLSVTGSAEIFRLEFGVGQGEYADPDFVRNRVDLAFEIELQPNP